MEHMHTLMNQSEPDNVVKMDLSTVKTLQIGYHGETIFLEMIDGDELILKEYIGYTAYEYLAKVNANRFKTTIRYGRREKVDTKAYIEIFLPRNWHGEFLVYTQYGHISCKDTIHLDRFAAESSEGSLTFNEIIAPRIRLASSSNVVTVEKAIGFADIHTTAGKILAGDINGGAKLETSTGKIDASFSGLNNVVECNTLSGVMDLHFTEDCNINVDGITKTGEIISEIEGVEVKAKAGKAKVVTGQHGQKPFQNVKLSTINGSINLC